MWYESIRGSNGRGNMLSKYAWLLILAATVGYKYQSLPEINLDAVHKWLRDVYYATGPQQERRPQEKVFTIDELKKHTAPENGLYLSILGNVFDVTEGGKHYKAGAPYHYFTGRDASLAFITGSAQDLTDDISSLTTDQVQSLHDQWFELYRTKYVYKGKLNGRFFDEYGNPTEAWYNVRRELEMAKVQKMQKQMMDKIFPPCNIEYNVNTGTVVWCTDRSGGIKRDWIGVPRMYYESPGDKQYRCVCINLESNDYGKSKQKFKTYAGCELSSPRCTYTSK